MRFEGRVFKVGRHWAVEVGILGVVSQGRTTPSVQKLWDLLSAVVPDRDFVLVESRARGGTIQCGSGSLAPRSPKQ